MEENEEEGAHMVVEKLEDDKLVMEVADELVREVALLEENKGEDICVVVEKLEGDKLELAEEKAGP